MLKKILTALLFVYAFQSINAQTDSTKKSTTTFSGSLDGYYRYNFADAPSVTNNLTSFTNSQNSFELGMASARVDQTYGKVSASVDLGFGRRVQEFSYNDAGSLVILKQAYLSFAASDKVKFTAGKWATHVGYELVDAPGNRNYSMSYGFSYGPFFHTGLKADISLGGKSAIMVGLANTTDYSTTTTSVKYLLAQFSTGTKNDKIKAYLNFQAGGEVSQYNIVATAVLAAKWSMAYDGSIQQTKSAGTTSSWTSNAVYINYDPTSIFGLTLRQDFFSDRKINKLINGENIAATTLSANIKIDHLTIIPEIRYDMSNQDLFSKSNGSLGKNTNTFILAAYYKF